MANKVFIDTVFVIALINENDQHHQKALTSSNSLKNHTFVTTDAVLLEVGNALAKNYKQEAIEVIQNFEASDDTEIIHLTPSIFRKAFEIYKSYQDKTWGLVDCISFTVMQDFGITDALTADKHFGQFGFNILMK